MKPVWEELVANSELPLGDLIPTMHTARARDLFVWPPPVRPILLEMSDKPALTETVTTDYVRELTVTATELVRASWLGSLVIPVRIRQWQGHSAKQT